MIVSDDLYAFSVDDVTLAEGDAATDFVFTVSVSPAIEASDTATVKWRTSEDTAVAGSDYTEVGETTLTFTNAGPLTQTVTVQVTGDVNVESSEAFEVNLSNPVNAAVSDGQGAGTIINDDVL